MLLISLETENMIRWIKRERASSVVIYSTLELKPLHTVFGQENTLIKEKFAKVIRG